MPAPEATARYSHARKWIPQRWADPLPFTYEGTGIETNFRDQRAPDSRSRPVFAFHTPEHLLDLARPPYHIAPAEVWKAYEHLGKRPPTSDPVKTLTNLITLVHHTVDPEHQPLAPFPELVEQRFEAWLSQQNGKAADSQPGTKNSEPGTPRFTESQLVWLKVIKDCVALNGAFATDDQAAYLDAWQSVDSDDVSSVALAKEEGVPLAVAKKAFGQDPKEIIEELNEVLVA